jgi:hypothetical protein
MTTLKRIAAASTVALMAAGLAAGSAEARNGRNAAFAAGAAVGVVGGAALAGAAYNNSAYSVPANGCYGAYDCDPYYGSGTVQTETAYYGSAPTYYAPAPTYYAPAPTYYAPAPVYRAPPVVYGDPYPASAGDIARWRFENRK